MTDELPSYLFIAGVSFLLGFELAAWMGKQQIERLKKTWRVPPCDAGSQL